MVRQLILLTILCASLSAAEYDMTYLQRDGAAEFQERTITLTPSTFLSVGSDGRLRVDTSSAFKAALGIGVADVSGLQTALNAPVWEYLTYSAGTSSAASNVLPSKRCAWFTINCYSSFEYNATAVGIGLPYTGQQAGQLLKFTAGTLASYPSALPIKIYARDPGPGTFSNLLATLTMTGQSVTLIAKDAYYWQVVPTDTHAASHATGGTDALTPAAIGAATSAALTSHTGNTSNPHSVTKAQVGLGNVENTALSTWAGSGNLTTVGTLASGAIPWSLVTGKPTLGTAAATDASAYATAAQGVLAASALQAGTAIANVSGLQTALDGTPSLTGNNTFSGNNTFTGAISLDLATTVTFQRVNIGSSDYGWRYNPASGGQVEFVFPGGTAAFYQTGSPSAPYMYFAGTIQADYLVGAISGVTINSSGLSGIIPINVVSDSLSDTLNNWLSIESRAGPAGVVYAATGPLSTSEPTPALSYYYPAAYVTDGGTDDPNHLQGKYRSPVQLRTDLFPSASASLDFPSIAAAASASLTITVSGAVTTNTPTVSLGWSATLPAGIVVSHAWVSASNTVTVTLTNISGAAVDPAAVTCRASVTQY
ncbi:MAG: hypothetical protein ACOYM3_04665 [Terrimicrobiaceae bacterium]